MNRRITRTSPNGPRPEPPEPKPESRREVCISFRVRTPLYPGELAEATRIALEAAGVEVISCRAEFAKPKA